MMRATAATLSRTAWDRLRRFAADDEGATAIEYGLIALGIGVAIVVSIGLIGSALDTSFTDIAGMF